MLAKFFARLMKEYSVFEPLLMSGKINYIKKNLYRLSSAQSILSSMIKCFSRYKGYEMHSFVEENPLEYSRFFDNMNMMFMLSIKDYITKELVRLNKYDDFCEFLICFTSLDSVDSFFQSFITNKRLNISTYISEDTEETEYWDELIDDLQCGFDDIMLGRYRDYSIGT